MRLMIALSGLTRQTSTPRSNRVFEGVCENNLFALPPPLVKEITNHKINYQSILGEIAGGIFV